HGGSPGVSDIEIERAIVYMVNQSGGHWIEPIGGGTPDVVRTSEQIVQNQCGKCHQTGLGGAPKIGERAEWIPRLKKGLDTLVASAIHGHGQMPARGGLPDLSDQEIRGSIVYMFSYGVAQIPAPAPSLAPAVDPYHKTIAGTEVYLGIVPADAIRATKPKGTPEAVMHGGVPSGRGYYHVNISLVDSKSKVLVTEAEVKVRVADALGGETKSLDLMSASNTISYGNYFRMVARHPYTITAEIRRPGTPGTIEAKFDYKTP
ncbi:MAG: cytochrome c5 family protein, partial [Betaproteobacteria bacterium]